MLICNQKHLNNRSFMFETCRNPATEIVWCPTWINTDGTLPLMSSGVASGMIKKGNNKVTNQPPMTVCSGCARLFKPEFNPHADGRFFWGDEARTKFEEAKKLGLTC